MPRKILKKKTSNNVCIWSFINQIHPSIYSYVLFSLFIISQYVKSFACYYFVIILFIVILFIYYSILLLLFQYLLFFVIIILLLFCYVIICYYFVYYYLFLVSMWKVLLEYTLSCLPHPPFCILSFPPSFPHSIFLLFSPYSWPTFPSFPTLHLSINPSICSSLPHVPPSFLFFPLFLHYRFSFVILSFLTNTSLSFPLFPYSFSFFPSLCIYFTPLLPSLSPLFTFSLLPFFIHLLSSLHPFNIPSYSTIVRVCWFISSFFLLVLSPPFFPLLCFWLDYPLIRLL